MSDYQLPDLPYSYDALEPVISREIMEIHHSKHHKAYVTNLNAALEKYHEAESRKDMAAMVALQSAIKFNGGGHINHSIFWQTLTPVTQAEGQPSGALAEAIQKKFGSFEKFKEQLTEQSLAIQGSGWGWLGYCAKSKSLKITTCANQDPLSTQGLFPLFGIDVWEHAYYLQYKNVRLEYIKNIWGIVNWKEVEKRFNKNPA